MNATHNVAEPITDEEVMQPAADDSAGSVAPIKALEVAPLAPQPTLADYRAALHNPDTPAPVKRAIKQHLHGQPGGRRELRNQHMTSHNISQHSQIENPAHKPKGVSGRQWRKQRKALRRVHRAINAVVGQVET